MRPCTRRPHLLPAPAPAHPRHRLPAAAIRTPPSPLSESKSLARRQSTPARHRRPPHPARPAGPHRPCPAGRPPPARHRHCPCGHHARGQAKVPRPGGPSAIRPAGRAGSSRHRPGRGHPHRRRPCRNRRNCGHHPDPFQPRPRSAHRAICPHRQGRPPPPARPAPLPAAGRTAAPPRHGPHAAGPLPCAAPACRQSSSPSGVPA